MRDFDDNVVDARSVAHAAAHAVTHAWKFFSLCLSCSFVPL